MDDTLEWLLSGDPAVAWQVHRDLLQEPWGPLRARVPQEGWGAQLLSHRRPDGSWPPGWYTPKWTSTFYSLQLLQLLGVPAADSVRLLLARFLEGGLFRPWDLGRDDVCVTGMMLAMAHEADVPMPGAVGRLLEQQLPDGGWNCRTQDHHSSLHTTLSVLEGLAGAAPEAEAAGREFLLRHSLFRSHRTGDVIRADFTRFAFPYYWYYDVLRALDYWRAHEWDERLAEAVDLVRGRERAGRWLRQNRHRGQVWFEMEEVGRPSRWNTLRALRVLRWAGAHT